jgi:hypothetical protein
MTSVIAIGWIIALLYYFINVLVLRQICYQSVGNLRNVIIITFSIIGILLVIFWGTNLYVNLGVKNNIGDSSNEDSFVDYDDYNVKIRTITITPEDYDSDHSWDNAKFTAEYILSKWKNGEATEQSMIEIMDEYGFEQGGGKLISINRREYVEEIDEWCFDRNRKAGDVAIIENIYGYTIIYFSGISKN